MSIITFTPLNEASSLYPLSSDTHITSSLANVFSWLDVHHHGLLATVCKTFNQIVNSGIEEGKNARKYLLGRLNIERVYFKSDLHDLFSIFFQLLDNMLSHLPAEQSKMLKIEVLKLWSDDIIKPITNHIYNLNLILERENIERIYFKFDFNDPGSIISQMLDYLHSRLHAEQTTELEYELIKGLFAYINREVHKDFSKLLINTIKNYLNCSKKCIQLNIRDLIVDDTQINNQNLARYNADPASDRSQSFIKQLAVKMAVNDETMDLFGMYFSFKFYKKLWLLLKDVPPPHQKLDSLSLMDDSETEEDLEIYDIDVVQINQDIALPDHKDKVSLYLKHNLFIAAVFTILIYISITNC